jgi:hypothetical protein
VDAKQAGKWIRQHAADTDEDAARALVVFVEDAYLLGTRRCAQKVLDFGRALEETVNDVERNRAYLSSGLKKHVPPMTKEKR